MIKRERVGKERWLTVHSGVFSCAEGCEGQEFQGLGGRDEDAGDSLKDERRAIRRGCDLRIMFYVLLESL